MYHIRVYCNVCSSIRSIYDHIYCTDASSKEISTVMIVAQQELSILSIVTFVAQQELPIISIVTFVVQTKYLL